jgi:glycerate kinase
MQFKRYGILPGSSYPDFSKMNLCSQKEGKKMKVVIAIDSLKGSLSSMEAGEAIAEGIHLADPEAETIVRPLADGGEGTVDALIEGMNGERHTVTVTGPHGRPVSCDYGTIGQTAVIEMSGAAGITMVSGEERNPLLTTTYGVGEVIRDAIGKGCRRFIVGIGGSATNDGGIGMLQALGFGFLDQDGNDVARAGAGLRDLARITTDRVIPELKDCFFQIACDVTNPLCGEKGCSAVYGPQKGATPEIVKTMDGWLSAYAKLAKETVGENEDHRGDAEYPGTGAAGGLGFAFLTFTNAVLESGISIVLKETGLENYVKDADLVITGEGRLDEQTAMGKAPIGVAKLGKKYKKPVLAFSGSVTKDATACNQNGIDAFFPILRRIQTLEEAMDPENARENMRDTVEQAIRLFKVAN